MTPSQSVGGRGRGRGRGKVANTEVGASNLTGNEQRGIVSDGDGVGWGNEVRKLIGSGPLGDLERRKEELEAGYEADTEYTTKKGASSSRKDGGAVVKHDNTSGQGVGKGRTEFWGRHQDFEIPPIPFESGDVLEDEDLARYAEDIIGFGERNVERSEEPRPVFSRKILRQKSDGRHFMIFANASVKLPKDRQLRTRLLCVDSRDVLHLRCEDSEQPNGDPKVGSLKYLNKRLKQHYSSSVNQNKARVGLNNWIPQYGEVVAVRIHKQQPIEVVPNKYSSGPTFERAVVRELSPDLIVVELIDSYGIGGVQLCDVFKIRHEFTLLPPQVFQCELAEMGLVNYTKVVHGVLKACSIRNIWPDCEMNNVLMTWTGEYSSRHRRPLVEILIQTRSSPTPEYVSLQAFVMQNIRTVLRSAVRIQTATPKVRVLDADKYGFLWITFHSDQELRIRVRTVLDKLLLYYDALLKHCHLTTCNLSPQGEAFKHLRERNRKKLYVIALPTEDIETTTGLKGRSLYRVGIEQVYHDTQEVVVRCVDEHVFRKVKSHDLVPLSCLYQDLAYIPPLVSKVRLYKILDINLDEPEVREILSAKNLQMKMVTEKILDIWPPEVTMFNKAIKEPTENVPNQISGVSRYFVEKNWARLLEDDAMNLVHEKVQEEVERRQMDNLDEDEVEEETLRLLRCQTYTDTKYVFINERRTSGHLVPPKDPPASDPPQKE